MIGLLLGAPLLTIPGVGPILLAGPIAMGLTGAVVGEFLGSMAGWGVHKDDVAHCEQEVKDGALLIVASGSPDEVATAQPILRETHVRKFDLLVRTSADEVSQ